MSNPVERLQQIRVELSQLEERKDSLETEAKSLRAEIASVMLPSVRGPNRRGVSAAIRTLLAEHPEGLTIRQMTERMGGAVHTNFGLCNSMVSSGMVSKARDSQDRLVWTLTRKGRLYTEADAADPSPASGKVEP